ncbi:MAG: DsrE family protein [Nitrospirae bacterium]|nr:DsrE family protein [Nitrospirota bacterium]
MARAVHALLYAKELKLKGHEVVLVFDGAGTEWAEAWKQPDHKLHAKYEELRQMGIVEELCDFCSGAFKVKDGLKQMSVDTLVSEFEGHPSLAKWISRGYEVLILQITCLWINGP